MIASCERACHLGEQSNPESWRAIRDAHDEFPEIWRSLDRARHVLARRGVNVTGYDELRPRVRTRLATADETEAVRVDPDALDDARRAAEELKMAVPGADWVAIEQRTSGLVHLPIHKRQRNRLVVGGVIVGLTVAVLSWAASIMPHKKPNPHFEMQHEIAQLVIQRKVKIVELQRSLGERCDPAQAHELAKQLVMDGRVDEAKQLAGTYEGRCGDDAELEKWAAAPRPR
ncbi:MAG TPA: hypothetical protein VFP84_26210 [Kofleriaceae bacterium]|nr:hypothetical protein [Kofleriaceae bacterium]